MQSIRSLLFTNTSNRHAVLRNSFWRFFATGFYKAIRFLAVVLAARWLGPAEFGSYSYALALASVAFIVSEWGINVLFTRDIQANGANVNKIFSTALFLKSGFTVLSLIAGFILSFLPTTQATFLIQLVVVTFAITNIRELFVSAMIARHRSELETLTVFFEGVVTVLLIATLFYSQRTAAVFMEISLIAAFVGLLVSGFLIYRFLGIRFDSFSAKDVRALFIDGLPLALFGIIGYVFFTADQLFIEYYLGVEAVGYYSFATRIIYTLILVPTLFTSVLFPLFARKRAEGLEVKKLFNQVTLGLALMGCFFGAILPFSDKLILYIAPQYAASIPVLLVLGGLLLFLFPSLWLDYVLVALHKQRQNFLITCAAAIVNVVLNMLFIPRYGILGAAYATVVSQCINVSVTYCYARFILSKQEKQIVH